MIHIIAVAMKGKLTCGELAEIIPVHPSFSEGVVETARRSPAAGLVAFEQRLGEPRPGGMV